MILPETKKRFLPVSMLAPVTQYGTNSSKHLSLKRTTYLFAIRKG
jgi:hypothetical protein